MRWGEAAEEDWGWQRGGGGWWVVAWGALGAADEVASVVCGRSVAGSHF